MGTKKFELFGNLATVATSGSYNDLSNKPTIPKAYTHPNSGVTAGTYNTVTVNAQGHVTAGSNVTVDLSGRVAVSGARGTLAGYESSGTSTTINGSSPDSNEVSSAITVSNGEAGTSWTKIVRVTGEVTVTLGSAWVWQGGSAPTIVAGGVLVCCWCGSGGIAQFVSPS